MFWIYDDKGLTNKHQDMGKYSTEEISIFNKELKGMVPFQFGFLGFWWLAAIFWTAVSLAPVDGMQIFLLFSIPLDFVVLLCTPAWWVCSVIILVDYFDSKILLKNRCGKDWL